MELTMVIVREYLVLLREEIRRLCILSPKYAIGDVVFVEREKLS
jgi:hypothetical protein